MEARLILVTCTYILEVRWARSSAVEGAACMSHGGCGPPNLDSSALGDKDLMFSHCFGVSSCYGASSPPSLTLCSPWVMGRTQPAPPSSGVSAPLSVSHGAGQWDVSFPPLPRYQCKVAASSTPGPYRHVGSGVLPASFLAVRQCVSPCLSPRLLQPSLPAVLQRFHR